MEIVKKVPPELSNIRLDKVSSEIFKDFSRSQLKNGLLMEGLLLNNEIASPKDTVNQDDEILINPISEIKFLGSQKKLEFELIHKDENYLIINKPPNLVMHPGAGCNNGTLGKWITISFSRT
jgi:23S rRNA pseudouridine1911/1915/1917 synthase